MSFWTVLPSRRPSTENVLRKERPRVYRIALAITSSRDAAEDVTQEVLCRYLKSAETVENPRAWLRRTAIRCAAECGAPKETELPDEVLARSQAPEETLAVAATLAELSLEHRTILALALLEQLSYREIAQTLEIPMGSVASRLHHAKQAFRNRWQP